MSDKRSTFRISLWDHEDGPCGRFSPELATRWLGRPATGLTPYQLNRVLREVREQWADEMFLVEAESPLTDAN